jgi:hypothetical protein
MPPKAKARGAVGLKRTASVLDGPEGANKRPQRRPDKSFRQALISAALADDLEQFKILAEEEDYAHYPERLKRRVEFGQSDMPGQHDDATPNLGPPIGMGWGFEFPRSLPVLLVLVLALAHNIVQFCCTAFRCDINNYAIDSHGCVPYWLLNWHRDGRRGDHANMFRMLLLLLENGAEPRDALGLIQNRGWADEPAALPVLQWLLRRLACVPSTLDVDMANHEYSTVFLPQYDNCIASMILAAQTSAPYPSFPSVFDTTTPRALDTVLETDSITLRFAQIKLYWNGWSRVLHQMFLGREKLPLERIWSAGLIGALANPFLAFHKQRNTWRPKKSHKLKFMTCPLPSLDWRHMHRHPELLTSEWLSVQQPDPELLECRKEHPEALRGPTFMGLRCPQARKAIVSAFHVNQSSSIYLFRLWALREREQIEPFTLYEIHPSERQLRRRSKQQERNRAALFRLPQELLLYILNAVWIESLLCPCWNNDYQRCVETMFRCKDATMLV